MSDFVFRETSISSLAKLVCSTLVGLSLVQNLVAQDTSSPSIQKAQIVPKVNSLQKQALAEQRYHYELAKGALEKDNIAAFEKHYAMLGDYPLTPYLDYSRIKKDVLATDPAVIDQFLSDHDGTFLGYRLREQYLQALANKKRWNEFLRYYDTSTRQRSLQCRYLEAGLAKEKKDIHEKIAMLWTEGKSHPKSCDPLFKQWRRQGGLSDEIAWTRFHNAMLKNKRSLAIYVAGLMSEEYKQIAQEYLGIHAYPGRVKQHRRYSDSSLKTQQIIAHGIKRFSRIDPKEALYQWELYEARQLFPKEITVDTKIYLIKKLASKGFVNEAESLIDNSRELRQKDVVERLLREALRGQDYAKLIKWRNYLDDNTKNTDRWRYWLARAQDELGIESGETSIDIYRSLSQNRSFYGFLSADILNREYSLGHNPSKVAESLRLRIENLPAIARSKELWLKGNYSEARAEWHFATKRMEKPELAAAGQIARKWGWYNKGIHAMIRGKIWDDLDIRFPLAYRDTVEKVSSKTAIEKTFIYAIARQESAFSEKARSSAGAMGLMQLMPGTARQTARKSGIKHRDSYLFDPEYNINLGGQYLNELLGRFNGNRILAAAAYNAGPHRVDKWIKRNPPELPFDIWIETIPFHETRGYVQNVLSFSVIYAYRLGQSSDLVTELEVKSPL